MAGDIFFTDSRVWSSSSNFFVDIMTRAISKCGANEDSLIQTLRTAERIRCLGINLQENRSMKIVLTERVLQAARGKLEELRTDPATHPGDIGIVEELIAMAQEHFRELGGASIGAESQL